MLKFHRFTRQHDAISMRFTQDLVYTNITGKKHLFVLSGYVRVHKSSFDFPIGQILMDFVKSQIFTLCQCKREKTASPCSFTNSLYTFWDRYRGHQRHFHSFVSIVNKLKQKSAIQDGVHQFLLLCALVFCLCNWLTKTIRFMGLFSYAVIRCCSDIVAAIFLFASRYSWR